MIQNLPELTKALDEVEFFERARTDRQLDEVAILLYNCGMSLRNCASARLAWCRAVACSDLDVDSEVRSPTVMLLDETVVKQREEFTLFPAVEPEMCHLLHASVAPSRNTLTTRRFLTELPGWMGDRRQSW